MTDLRKRFTRRLERVTYLAQQLRGLGGALDEIRLKISEQVSDSAQIAESVGRPIQCPSTPGCWGCCRGEIPVSREELRRISAKMDEAAWGRVEASAEQISSDPRHTLCPLLDPVTKACTVYDERPIVCRAYVAITPRSWCYPEQTGTKDTATIGEPARLAVAAIMHEPRQISLGTELVHLSRQRR